METNKRRSVGKVDRLPSQHKDTVEQMLLSGMTYREIVEYLREHGHPMSQMAISTYARKFIATVQKLNIAQDNFKMMMEETDKYPNLDTTESIARMLSFYMFSAITSRTEEDWQDVKLDKLIQEANGLIRAVAHKKRVDMQNQSDFDAGIEAARSLVFDALAKERPDLYQQLNSYLSEKKEQTQ